MRIISMRIQPISSITKDIMERRKGQQEIIDNIKSLKKQTPKGRFFTYLNRQYGKNEVEIFKEALIQVQRAYARNKDMVDIYKELNMNNPLDVYKSNQMNLKQTHNLSIYADKDI